MTAKPFGPSGGCPVCTVVGCGATPHARGLCDRHYKRAMRHGSPHAVNYAEGARNAMADPENVARMLAGRWTSQVGEITWREMLAGGLTAEDYARDAELRRGAFEEALPYARERVKALYEYRRLTGWRPPR